MSEALLGSLMHGWPGLMLGYASVQAPLLAGLARARAGAHRLWLSPLAAAPLTAVAGGAAALARPTLAALGLAPDGIGQFLAGGLLAVGCGYLGGRLLAPRAAQSSGYRRGARVLTEVASAMRTESDANGAARQASRVRPGQANRISLAGVPLGAADETRHFKLIGTTGTGKSSAIGELLGAALARGDRAVIADPDAGYWRRLGDPDRGDRVLNPFEPHSMKWDLFGELRADYDVAQLARSLIPDQEGSDRSWRGYARTFFTAVTRQARAAGVREVGELYRLLVIADAAELRTLVRGTPAQPFLEEQNGRMFDSLRSVTSSAVGALEYVAAQTGPALSVRDWVSAQRPGVLFLPYRAGQIAALRSLVSAWMRLAVFEAMEGSEQNDQRLWFVVDELDALGPIDGLKDALARVRKFGGRCVLGLQSIAQVASTYGAGDAHTIVENCGNSLILRCSASEGGGTSRFASSLIGQREVVRTTRAWSRRPNELLSSCTRSEQVTIEPAVMGAQIERLADFEGYLKLASHPDWLHVRLPRPSAAKGAGARKPAAAAEYEP